MDYGDRIGVHEKTYWEELIMFRILAIGNSFSEDATYYLHDILDAAGIENQVVNLYIGGCSLERHWLNIERNSHDYLLEFNGKKTDRYVSIDDALDMAKWDIIVTQQASHDSGWAVTYEPFLGLILDHIKEKAGDTKVYLQETWAYAKDSTHDRFMRYRKDQNEMYENLKKNYYGMADKYGLGLIPCGDLIQSFRATARFNEETGEIPICRDGFHMNYIYGRYALACLWAKTLCNIDIINNGFIPSSDYVPLEEARPEVLKEIREQIRSIGR